MQQTKSKSESMISLFEKALKKEIFNYIDQMFEEKINPKHTVNVESKALLDAKEVCEKYRISKSTLERYVRNGLRFNSQKKGGKRIFKLKDLENWFENKNTNKQKNRNNGR